MENYRKITFTLEDTFTREKKKTSLQSTYRDCPSLNETIETFQQFLHSLGYNDDSIKQSLEEMYNIGELEE